MGGRALADDIPVSSAEASVDGVACTSVTVLRRRSPLTASTSCAMRLGVELTRRMTQRRR